MPSKRPSSCSVVIADAHRPATTRLNLRGAAFLVHRAYLRAACLLDELFFSVNFFGGRNDVGEKVSGCRASGERPSPGRARGDPDDGCCS